MRRPFMLFVLALLAAAPAAAQPKVKPVQTVQLQAALVSQAAPAAPAARVDPVVIHAGDSVQGRLEEGDERHSTRGLTDTFLIEGHEGETLVVTLRSPDFDTLIAMGRPTHSGCRPMDGNDNGAGGTDSRLTFDVQQNGPLHIHVRAREGGTGAYTLTVERQ